MSRLSNFRLILIQCYENFGVKLHTSKLRRRSLSLTDDSEFGLYCPPTEFWYIFGSNKCLFELQNAFSSTNLGIRGVFTTPLTDEGGVAMGREILGSVLCFAVVAFGFSVLVRFLGAQLPSPSRFWF